MDSRERAALNKAVGAAMDAVNERQDAAIADLKAEVDVIRNVLVDAGIWPEVKAVKHEKAAKKAKE